VAGSIELLLYIIVYAARRGVNCVIRETVKGSADPALTERITTHLVGLATIPERGSAAAQSLGGLHMSCAIGVLCALWLCCAVPDMLE
jgi:hypothetical protein